MTRPGPAFSNGTEYEMWKENWCYRCTRDAAFQRGETDDGCPLLLTAICGDIPGEWMEQPRDRYPFDAYHCIDFRGPDDPDQEPRPQPDPPDMDGLFDCPPRCSRMLVQPASILVGADT